MDKDVERFDTVKDSSSYVNKSQFRKKICALTFEIFFAQANNEDHARATTLNEFFISKNSKGNSGTDIHGFGEKVDQEIISGTDIDSFDLTTGMQEAMHLSNIEMRQASYT